VEYVKTVADNSGGRIRYEDMGYTVYNRPLPLAIVGIPRAPQTPAEVGDRIVIHMQCAIHSGEIEGKEASLLLLREIAQGKHDALLKNVVLLVNSTFNPDGNDAIGPWRQNSQPTPVMVGTRTNAQGYNLNRDFTKLDSPEARAHLKTFRKWNPSIVMDLHATDGNRHRHPLCYGYGNNLNNDQDFEDFNRLFAESIYGVGIGTNANPATNFFQTYMKAIIANADNEPLFEGNYYPLKNASLRAIPYTEGAVVTALTSGNGHQVRYTSNLPTAKNRIALLYEVHSHNKFRYRVHTAYAATLSTFEQAVKQKDVILKTIKDKDDAMSKRTSVTTNDVIWLGARGSFNNDDYNVDFDLGVGVGQVKVDTFTGTTAANYDYSSTIDRVIPNRSKFIPLASNPTTRMGALYIMDPAAVSSARMLMRQGVEVYRLKENVTLPANQTEKFYNPDDARGNWRVSKSTSGYEGRNLVTITSGDWNPVADSGHVVTKEHYVISTAQPFGKVAAYWLEPRADDSLCNWGFWDGQLFSTENNASGSFDIVKTYSYTAIPKSALELLYLQEDVEPDLPPTPYAPGFTPGTPVTLQPKEPEFDPDASTFTITFNEDLLQDGDNVWFFFYTPTNLDGEDYTAAIFAQVNKVGDGEFSVSFDTKTLHKYGIKSGETYKISYLLPFFDYIKGYLSSIEINYTPTPDPDPDPDPDPLPKKHSGGCTTTYAMLAVLALVPFFVLKKR